MQPQAPKKNNRMIWIAAAAAIFLFLSCCFCSGALYFASSQGILDGIAADDDRAVENPLCQRSTNKECTECCKVFGFKKGKSKNLLPFSDPDVCTCIR